ncbi:Hypothetical predicted protein, partial [Paramuricea clavata]
KYGSTKSTKLAVALLCDDIRSEMNKGNLVGVVYLDLSILKPSGMPPYSINFLHSV